MAAMTFSHYTGRGFRYSPRHRYDQSRHDGGYFKPEGLWLSVDGEDDWISWCRSEEFASDRLIERHIFQIKEGADILFIKNGAELEAFTAKYSTSLPGMPSSSYRVIDWPRVRKRYDGIIIAPYQWSHRLKSGYSWYYGWDCASGCVWNLAAVHYVGQGLLPARKEEDAA